MCSDKLERLLTPQCNRENNSMVELCALEEPYSLFETSTFTPSRACQTITFTVYMDILFQNYKR